MKWILAVATLLLIASCGGGNQNEVDPKITTVPGLSENPGTDISLYTLNPLRISEASIILPEDSPTTIEEVRQNSIFSIIREPYSGTFNEGNIDNALVITLKVLNIPNRTRVPYIISGIDANDIESMVLNGASMPVSLAGYFDLGSQGAVGFANLVLIFKSDQVTEGTETLTLNLATGWANVDALSVTAQINDTSTTPPPPLSPTYSLSKNITTSIDEGSTSPVTITLSTANLPANTAVPYSITGGFFTDSDIETMVINGQSITPSLYGYFVTNSQGISTMSLTFKADRMTEGSETMILGLPTVNGTPTVSITVNDVSTTPPTAIDTISPIISITQVSNFVANSSMTVNGVAVDNVGISSVSWINRIDGVIVNQGLASLTQYGNYATWVATIPLQLGNNNIEFITLDTSGRSTYEIMVVSGSVAMVSGQSSNELEPNEEITQVAENPEALADKEVDMMAKDDREPAMLAVSNGAMIQLGLKSDRIINLSALNIPRPPAEVHPCNKGHILHIHLMNPSNVEATLEDGWWLLASATSNGNIDLKKVHFYWAQRIGEHALGVYDTGIYIDNVENIGREDARLDLGWAVVPYGFSTYVGLGSLPVSRTEVCMV
jgi:hypothetical protein